MGGYAGETAEEDHGRTALPFHGDTSSNLVGDVKIQPIRRSELRSPLEIEQEGFSADR
jgi:hypothetical protein